MLEYINFLSYITRFINAFFLPFFMDFQSLRSELLTKTKQQLHDAVTIDVSISQALSAYDDLQVQLNHLSKRLRDWTGYFVPELERRISTNAHFVQEISRGLAHEDSAMGGTPAQPTQQIIERFAKQINELYSFQEELLMYLEKTLQEFAPNLQVLLGTTITARVISAAGSLEHLSRLPSSTLQLLGAEKALFRHLRTGARSPKHGFIINHPLVSQASSKMRGKIARALADKMSICAKLDYFKGEFLAKKYLQDLEKRFG